MKALTPSVGMFLLATTAFAQHSEHGGEHPHADHLHDKQLSMSVAEAPTLKLSIHNGSRGRYTIKLSTTNFRFSREHGGHRHEPLLYLEVTPK